MSVDWPEIPWALLSDCIASQGQSSFVSSFTRLLDGPLAVMQCMVFLYAADGRMNCLLSLNLERADIAVPLASAFIRNGYKNDPNMQLIRSLDGEVPRIVRLSDVAERLPASYREHFFRRPGLVDKVSYLRKREASVFYVNFYRGRKDGRIKRGDLLADDGFVGFIGDILIRHFLMDNGSHSTGPLAFLSDRERQVCKGILRGQKAEQIAHQLGLSSHTVTTYRKRAYQKLGISSRADLFLLCD